MARGSREAGGTRSVRLSTLYSVDIRPRVDGSEVLVGAPVADRGAVPDVDPVRVVGPAPRGPLPVTSGAGAPNLSAARARVQRHLQEHPEPGGRRGVGPRVRTAPEHGPQPSGRAGRRGTRPARAGAGSVRGRPPWRYRLDPENAEPDSRLREHQGLVIALAAHLAERSPQPRAEARSAGQSWGHALVSERASRSHGQRAEVAHATPAAARREVVRLLADLRVSPRADRDAVRVVLTTCPLLDVARRHPEVVCAVHEGMVAGALAALRGAGGDRDQLERTGPDERHGSPREPGGRRPPGSVRDCAGLCPHIASQRRHP